jgi:hypothetical protein
MKLIHNWHYLRPYGVIARRKIELPHYDFWMCELTEVGKELFQAVFKVIDVSLTPVKYPDSEQDPPSVGELWVPTTLFSPLAIMALLRAGCKEIYDFGSTGIIGISPEDPP